MNVVRVWVLGLDTGFCVHWNGNRDLLFVGTKVEWVRARFLPFARAHLIARIVFIILSAFCYNLAFQMNVEVNLIWYSIL